MMREEMQQRKYKWEEEVESERLDEGDGVKQEAGYRDKRSHA